MIHSISWNFRMPMIAHRMPLLTSITLLMLLALPGRAVLALHMPHCNSQPRMSWLSAGEVGHHLQQLGFQLVQIRMAEDKCYAVRVRHADGRLIDLIMHPVTAKIMNGASH